MNFKGRMFYTVSKTIILLALGCILLAGTLLASESNKPISNLPQIQTEVFFQDFENPADWNGVNPPTGWSVIDNGTADGTWDSFDWSRSAAWGGGTARVSGGTNTHYNNDWLISPSTDFSSASACTLFYRHYYDDYAIQAADSAIVLLSNNGGSSWGDTIMVYAGSDYGSETVPDSENFNISSFAAGHSAVKVAFQYVKRQAVLVGSWRIDDVIFRADGSIKMSQNFDSSWGPNGDNPPSNWAINDINVVKWDDNDWHQGNLSGWGNAAYVNWAPVEQQNELLISPVMNFSDTANNIILTLKQFYDDQPDTKDTAFVLGSINGGSTWADTVAIYQGADRGAASSPSYDTLNIFSWANLHNNVVIGFKYVGNNDGKWYVDSVRVERIDMFDSDVRTVSVDLPDTITIEGYAWPVSATVENAGFNTSTFGAILQIFDSTGTIVYSDTQAVNNLHSLTQKVVDFDPWTAAEPNFHAIRCFTRLVSDMDRTNDTVYASTLTYHHIGHDGPVEGWSYSDNITGGGQAYNWTDIKTSGIQINFSDADNGNSGMIQMGFNFDYFGSTYSKIAVSTNGWLSFDDTVSTDYSNSPIPDPDGPSAMIALLWADLHLRTGHVYYFLDAISHLFIVQYDSVEFKSAPGSDMGMEIIINGHDNTIKMQYQYFSGDPYYDITIGLENQAGDLGLAYDNDNQIGQTPRPGLAISYLYQLPHDIKILSIDQPSELIYGGSIYNIIATIKNAGANMESFVVSASDNYGYSSSQTVTNLPSQATTTATFTGWTISNTCSTYALQIVSNLSGDLNHANDSLDVSLSASEPANVNLALDDSTLLGAEADWPDSVLANKFTAFYANSTISSISYRFTDKHFLPDFPDLTHDSVRVYIFLDEDDNGFPDEQPIYTSNLQAVASGWTTWDVSCETTITLNCQAFWAAWSNYSNYNMEGISIDRQSNYPEDKWIKIGGIWQENNDHNGEYMIRAHIDADPATAPNIILGSNLVNGAAAPNGADTVANYIQNSGTACDLQYKIKVLQETGGPRNSSLSSNSDRIASGANRENLPSITGTGGPDNYGYTWDDSDDPNGPTFYWTNIYAIGTEVSWTHGNTNDGCTDLIPMDMTFNYYGNNYDSVMISTDGWISFLNNSDLLGMDNSSLPSIDFKAWIAVDWDNLDGGAIGHCYYYHDRAANTFTIAWVNWSHYPYPSNTHDFEVILDGTSGTILFQYQNGTYQSDITVGITNENGTDGLQVAYNEPYLHNDLAVRLSPPIFWLSTDLPNGLLPPLSGQSPFNIFMNASGLPAGIYNGAIIITSNDVDRPADTINVHFEVEGVCAYIPGDVNSSGVANGIDVSFMVNYFHGEAAPHDECSPCQSLGVNMLYPQGDVNGSCSWNGIDVTFFVNYLKGIGPILRFCDQCPPANLRAVPSKQSTPILISPVKIKPILVR
jgi:hypothetical protein